MILDIVMLALVVAACIGAAAYAGACDRLIDSGQRPEALEQ
jgi:hypothetical protein